MTENKLFVLDGSETQVHDILLTVHHGKTVVEARVRKILGSSRLQWMVVYVRACVRGVGL